MSALSEPMFWSESRNPKPAERPAPSVADDAMFAAAGASWTADIDETSRPAPTPAGDIRPAFDAGVSQGISQGMDLDIDPPLRPRAQTGDAAGLPAYAAPAAVVPSPAPKKETGAMPPLEHDARYRTMLTRMQYGQWPEVVEMLDALRADYPQQPTLEGLANEARLKAELVTYLGDENPGASSERSAGAAAAARAAAGVADRAGICGLGLL